MHILIIGSGSYVFGDRYGPGVVFRSVLAYLRSHGDATDAKVTITTRAEESIAGKQQTAQAILADWGPADLPTVEVVTTEQGLDLLAARACDAVMVAVPDAHHLTYALAAIKANCPIWLVKPLAGDSAASDQMLAAYETGQKPLFWVDYHKRFDPSNRYAKDQIRSDRLGRLLSYSVDYHQPWRLPVETFDWAADVDVFSYIGCHYVDQVFFHFPHARLIDATASGTRGKVHAATGQYDSIAAQLRFDIEGANLVVPMLVGWCLPDGAPMKSQQALKLQFEDGQITLAQDDRGISSWDAEGVTIPNPYFFTETTDAMGRRTVSGYGCESVRRFLDHVRLGTQPMADDPVLGSAAKSESVLAAVKSCL